MPLTSIAVQAIAKNAGAELVDVNADQANGNKFLNDGRTRLVITNGDGSPRTATVTSVADPFGRTGDVAVIVTNGKSAVIGPFDPLLFNQADGTITLNWSAGTTTAVKVRAIQTVG